MPLPHAADDLEPALQLRPVGEVGDVAGRKILDEMIAAAAGQIELRAQHDVLEAGHLVRPEGERSLRAHLHAGPAIVVVGGGHHGDAGHVEVELGEIGHRRHREADVVHLASRRQQAGDEGIFDRRGIAAEIVADHDLRLHAHLADQGAEAHAEGLYAHQVDFLLEQPPRIVFAKPGRLDHGLGFVGVGVREEGRLRRREHCDLGRTMRGADHAREEHIAQAGRVGKRLVRRRLVQPPARVTVPVPAGRPGIASECGRETTSRAGSVPAPRRAAPGRRHCAP